MKQDYSGKKVVIGLTGRLDSAVAAFLLKKQGMEVIGVSIVTNQDDNFDSPKFFPKCHITNLEAVKSLCYELKIPFYATDGKGRFDSEVFDPLVSSKLTAEANTSCYSCTSLKLNILFEKMLKLKADYIATGHFSKVHRNLINEEYFIHSNSDPEADQSYLLAGLSNELLKHLILPLGELNREDVEKIGEKFKLNCLPKTHFKKFCFEKKGSYFQYGIKRIPKSLIKEGQVLHKETEAFYGDHEGVFEHYITEKDLSFSDGLHVDKNVEVVGYDFNKGVIQVGGPECLTHKSFQIVKLKLGNGLDITKPLTCFLKNRFLTKPIKAIIYFKNNDSALIDCNEEIYPLIFKDNFVIFDRDSRNSKVIGLGEVGSIGDFNLIDRVSTFRRSEEGAEASQKFKYDRVFKF